MISVLFEIYGIVAACRFQASEGSSSGLAEAFGSGRQLARLSFTPTMPFRSAWACLIACSSERAMRLLGYPMARPSFGPTLPHSFQAPGKTVANLFCEPESALGCALLARFGSDHIVGLPPACIAPHAKALRSAFDDGNADEELEHIALETLYHLCGGVPASLIDQRIIRATAFIAAKLGEQLTLEAVAHHVGLSAGRFRHLFVKETGISFRAYLLWTRLNRALELGFGGTSWTDAAHTTNFADSAHLSRTTRRMYGLAPSSLRQQLPPASRPMTA